MVVGVVGHDCDVYILVPLRLICASVNVKDGFQFFVSSFCYAYGLCVFDGCVSTAGLVHRLFRNFGSERCAFLQQYGVREVRESVKDQHQTFHDRRCVRPSEGIRKHVP